MEYLLHILILISIYCTLAYSLDLVVGHCGLLSLGQAAFYGVGAYASGIAATSFGMPYPIALLAAVGIAVLLSFAVSVPSVFVHDDYFAIATFCFQMIVVSILSNWIDVTRGPLGISGIPEPNIFGWHVQSQLDFLMLTSGVAILAWVVVARLTRGAFGRVLHAIREDELFAESLGKNTAYFKAAAFAVSAGLAGAAGSLYAHYITYIDPTSFAVTESILILSMVIIGGAGSTWGPLIGTAILIAFPELLRFVGLPQAAAANLRQLFYGILLILIIVGRPQGIAGRRTGDG